MHQRHRTMNLHARQAAQPGDPLFSQRFDGVAAAISPIAAKSGCSLGDCFANSHSDSGSKKHFIRIADHALPAEIANAVHNLRGTCAAVSQIAAVKDQVGRGLPQIRQNGLKRGSVAVDVGNDCDAHHVPRAVNGSG